MLQHDQMKQDNTLYKDPFEDLDIMTNQWERLKKIWDVSSCILQKMGKNNFPSSLVPNTQLDGLETLPSQSITPPLKMKK